MIYFFVEGETDSLFIKSLFKNTDIHVYTYSSKKTSCEVQLIPCSFEKNLL